jgi:HAD superfamily hydrolase (TIGR01509 family)
MTTSTIPYGEIDTLFLDAGNTLVSIDFEWIGRELDDLGSTCSPDALRRAEAAARPAISRMLDEDRSRDVPRFSLTVYIEHMMAGLAEAGDDLGSDLQPLLSALVPRLSGQTARLWSWVIPGVGEALERFRSQGLRLVVVSNSDGTAAQSLREQALLPFIDEVIDSHNVGHEKPDPRIFAAALERCGADPRRTLHVGDLYAVDVVGARAAGLHALLLDPFGDWPPLDCARLPDLTALADALCDA